MSTNPTAGILEPPLSIHHPSRDRVPEAGWGGVSISTWMKIGVVALLMALLFRFNLSRLWLKTNPITGQENWGHAFFIPLIGLYYLFVHREELLSPRPVVAPRGSISLYWGILELVAMAGGLLIWAAYPRILDGLETGADAVGLLTQYHGWRIASLYLFLPYLVGTSLSLLFLIRRPELTAKLTNWAAGVWVPLGAWFMLALVAWGAGFFVYVVSQAAFSAFRTVLAMVSLLSLAGVLLASTRQLANRIRVVSNQLLASSAVWLGSFIMCWGVLFSLWGIFPGQNDFFKDVGMVIALFGVVLLLSGWAVMRVAWFPILFLFCGLPWPDQVYSWVAGPLQHLAAAVAVRFLTICNIPSQVAGTKIMMFVVPNQAPRVLNVEEACAGLRSLMTFVTLAGGWAFVFMSSRPLWHRLVQTASAVPIAIFCNVLRVSCTGLIDKWGGHEWSDGFAHRFVGLLLLVPAFFLILLVGWVLDNLFIEEADDADSPGAAATKMDKKVVLPNRTLAGAAGVKTPALSGDARSRKSGPVINPSQPRPTTVGQALQKPGAVRLPVPGNRPPPQVIRPKPLGTQPGASANPAPVKSAEIEKPASPRPAESPFKPRTNTESA